MIWVTRENSCIYVEEGAVICAVTLLSIYFLIHIVN